MAQSTRRVSGITRPVVRRVTECVAAMMVLLAATVPTAFAGESLAGHLLVAKPGMPDPRFAETVIFLVEHDRNGAMGFIVNRPMSEMPFDRLLKHHGLPGDAAPEGMAKVYSGGPVSSGQGFVLHSAEITYAHTRLIEGGFAVTPDPAILGDIAEGKGPRHSLIILGYAGWAPGQLESEIAHGGWDVVRADESLVFDEDDATKWMRARKRIGVEL